MALKETKQTKQQTKQQTNKQTNKEIWFPSSRVGELKF
jgi:hypothetical protein